MAQVTIVMPLYNKEAFVGRAIRSIIAQTMGDWRLIVVNDGSTDRSPDVVRGIDDDRIELLTQENMGPGAARNRGLERADTEYVAFLDADDEWYPWYLENSLNALKDRDIAFVSSMFYTWPSKFNSTQRLAEFDIELGTYCLDGKDDPVKVLEILVTITAWDTVLRTEIIQKYDGFLEKDKCSFGEDQVFLFRAALGERFMFIGPAAVRYHSEASDICLYGQPGPDIPYLSDPELLLSYCPEKKRDLLLSVLDLFALRKAMQLARHGQSGRARRLIKAFPNASNYHELYHQYRHYIIPGYRHWINCKNKLTDLLTSMSAKIGLTSVESSPKAAEMTSAPAMTYENEVED